VEEEPDRGVPLPTMTLARLALAQDDRSLAVATLKSLIDRDPDHIEAAKLLDELESTPPSESDPDGGGTPAGAKIAALQGWLDAVRLAAERRQQ
jgi:hypothetical protein